MKIAFLTLYSGLVDRGVETFVKEVGNRLAEKNEVIVFQAGASRGQEKYKVEQIKLNIDWDNKDASNTLKRKFFLDYWSRLITKFAFKCWPTLWREKFDVVVPTDGGWEKSLCWILKTFRGTKILVTGQSGRGYDDRWGLYWRPNIFVALTTEAQRWAIKVGLGVKVVKIPNGVDLEKFNPKVKPFSVDLPKPRILCASALTKQKRIDLIIKAVSKLEETSLMIVGDGDERESLEKLGKDSLGNRFRLFKAKYEDMPAIYRAADLFTMSSYSSEAFGIVYVEAMACGLPVVATDDETRREVVGEAGLFVDPENIDEYTKALDQALKTDWGDKPRKQAEKFSWDRIASEYEKVMSDMLK